MTQIIAAVLGIPLNLRRDQKFSVRRKQDVKKVSSFGRIAGSQEKDFLGVSGWGGVNPLINVQVWVRSASFIKLNLRASKRHENIKMWPFFLKLAGP